MLTQSGCLFCFSLAGFQRYEAFLCSLVHMMLDSVEDTLHMCEVLLLEVLTVLAKLDIVRYARSVGDRLHTRLL